MFPLFCEVYMDTVTLSFVLCLIFWFIFSQSRFQWLCINSMHSFKCKSTVIQRLVIIEDIWYQQHSSVYICEYAAIKSIL